MKDQTDDMRFPALVVGLLVGGLSVLAWAVLFAWLVR